MPSDMALQPGNVQWHNNEIQIAASLSAKLPRARKEGLQVSFNPLFQTALVRWLGSRRRRTSPAAGKREHKGRDRHADGCENRCDGNSLLTKQGANALRQ